MSGNFSLVKKNTFYSTITIFSRLFSNVFLFWILARIYGPEQFGIFTFAHALSTTFIIFADFGLDVLLITEIASNPDKKKEIIEKLFGIKLIFVISATILMLVSSQIFPIGRKSFELIFVFGFYLFFTSLNNFLFGIFRGYERFIFETRVSLISNISLIILAIIILFLKLDLMYVASIFVLTRVIGVLFSFFYLQSLDKTFRFKINFSDLGVLKSKTLIFGVHLVFSYLFFQIDTLLLAKISGEYSVGIYQSVFKLIMLPLVIPDILINSLTPTLSRLYYQSRTDWFSLGSSMGRILIMLIIPISVILFFYSTEIISLIYGLKNFGESIMVLKIFSLILFVRFLLEPFALMLTTSNRQKIRMWTVIVATLLNIVLNLYLIPRYGVNGAAFVSLIVNLIVAIIYFSFVEKEFRHWLFDIKNFISIFGSTVMVWLLKEFININFVFQIVLFGIFYFIAIYSFYLKENEKNILVSILKKTSI
ncbi:MAG: flippase [Ignavibacteria bacterium]